MNYTTVYVHFNGASNNYYFDVEFEDFKEKFKRSIAAVEYFQGDDTSGNLITICPQQCGVVEIVPRKKSTIT